MTMEMKGFPQKRRTDALTELRVNASRQGGGRDDDDAERKGKHKEEEREHGWGRVLERPLMES